MKISYQIILDYKKIEDVYKKICRNTRHKSKLIVFEFSKFANFVDIYLKLKNHTYCHGKYNVFLIKYPKYRIIMSENLQDKIVNHLVSIYVLFPLIEPHLLDINIATRPEKGLDAGIEYVKRVFNLIRNEYDEYYVLKCDVTKYFYNIDHAILMDKLKIIVKDHHLLELINNIISSTNSEYVNYNINNLINNEIKKLKCDNKSKEIIVNKLKKIPLYPKGKGLPIGNMTSQVLAIFYLNDLDHYIKEVLHIKYYIRYMDDFILFHKDKEYLKYCKDMISKQLSKIHLSLNDKTTIVKLTNGLVFLGYRFINKNNRTYVLMNKNMKKKVRKRYKKEGKNILNKYNGYLNRCICDNFKEKLEKNAS